MSGTRRLNPWPAFADMMFMLALTTLVVAAGVVTVTAKARADTERLASRLRELGLNPEDPQSCGLATRVVDKMEECLRQRGITPQRRGCSLSMDADIHFDPNSPTLSPKAEATAKLVAGCVIRGAEEVARFKDVSEGVGLDAVSIEGHADQCGYHRWKDLKAFGMQLPADRAKAVYTLVFDEVTSESSGYDDSARARILGRIATRSFGPYRPLANVECDCARPATCAANRRVEIVVQGKIGKGRPNWRPSEGIPFNSSVPPRIDPSEDTP